jgi:hypothetical protein
VRIDRVEVAAVDLVGGRVREFCRRRVALQASTKGQWFLVGWAAARGLPGLARAQALLLALDHDHAEAHEFLGHQATDQGWLWAADGRLLPRARFDRHLAQKGIELQGERFAVRCSGELRAAVAALLDLEQLGVEFPERFGAPLQLAEVLQPIRVDLALDAGSFAKWGFRPVAYYEPPPHGDLARTFFATAPATRPELLFFVGTQGLLYRGLIGEVALQDGRDRVAAWLEVGLGMQMEQALQGPSGFAAPREPQPEARLVLLAQARSVRLSALLHLPMYGGFYLLDDTATAMHWASAATFTAFLLDAVSQPPTRERFLAYVREALGAKKGDSSSLFDRCLGRRVEEFEQPFAEWLGRRRP